MSRGEYSNSGVHTTMANVELIEISNRGDIKNAGHKYMYFSTSESLNGHNSHTYTPWDM